VTRGVGRCLNRIRPRLFAGGAARQSGDPGSPQWSPTARAGDASSTAEVITFSSAAKRAWVHRSAELATKPDHAGQRGDPFVCPRCPEVRRFIACIEQPAVIAKLLTSLRVPTADGGCGLPQPPARPPFCRRERPPATFIDGCPPPTEPDRSAPLPCREASPST
jgi:hypothetical protein